VVPRMSYGGSALRWSAGDPDQLLALMTKDAVFRNIPTKPLVAGQPGAHD